MSTSTISPQTPIMISATTVKATSPAVNRDTKVTARDVDMALAQFTKRVNEALTALEAKVDLSERNTLVPSENAKHAIDSPKGAKLATSDTTLNRIRDLEVTLTRIESELKETRGSAQSLCGNFKTLERASNTFRGSFESFKGDLRSAKSPLMQQRKCIHTFKV